METYHILVLLVIISFFIICYRLLRGKKRKTEQYREFISPGDFGKIYLYGTSGMDDRWCYFVIQRCVSEGLYRVKYRNEYMHDIRVLDTVYIGRIYPCSKKEIKRFQSETWWK